MAKKERILVLDNSRNWLITIKNILSPDYELDLTTTPAQATECLKARHYSLAILDKRLPGGASGLDVLAQMRKIVPDLRAIIITGHPDEDSIVESVNIGTLGYISKGSKNLRAELTFLVDTITQRKHLTRRSKRGKGKLSSLLKSSVDAFMKDRDKDIQIFLSYEIKDREKVAQLYQKLLKLGFLPWMDKYSIKGGEKWGPEITKAIEESDFFLACFSPNSVSKRGVIQLELKQALEKQRRLLDSDSFIIPVRLAECDIPDSFKEYQWVNLYEKDGLQQLVEALLS